MVSQLKSDTARINGAKSRGPTTDEGKEKSSRNALKHGLTSTSGTILLACEDPTQFDETRTRFFGIHGPANPAEKDLVDEMFAARWRIRRMWTIETGLLNAEIITQQSKSESSDPDIHLASAFRTLSDDSRSLVLASRYEARLQRLHDRAYKTLRELQQARKSEPPEQRHNIRIRWVAPQEESDQPAVAAASPNQPPQSPGASPTEPRASASGPEPKLPNKPAAAANKEVNNQPNPVAQAFVPVFRTADPPAEPPSSQSSIRNPKSEIRNPSSQRYNEK